MNNKSQAFSEWKLEQYMLGILPEAEKQEVQLLLNDSAEAREFIKLYEQNDIIFQEQHLKHRVLNKIKDSNNHPKFDSFIKNIMSRFTLSPARSFVPVVSLLCVITFIFFSKNETPRNQIKSGNGMSSSFVVAHDNDFKEGVSGETVYEGDKIQISYSIPFSGYLYVIGILPDNDIDVYYPSGFDKQNIIKKETLKNSNFSLPFALELDGDLGEEIIIGILSIEQLDLKKLQKVVQYNKTNPLKENTLHKNTTISHFLLHRVKER